MMRTLILIVLLSALSATAQSQHSPKPPNTEAKSGDSSAEADQRGTNQSPLIVKVIPTQKSEAESAQDAKDKDEKLDTDRWLARFTGWLVVVGILQLIVFGLQALRLRQTIKEMKIATKATEKAAAAAERTVKTMEDTAERQLRAYVLVLEGSITIIDNGNAIRAFLRIKNSGQTPAHHVTTWASMEKRDLPQLAPTFDDGPSIEERDGEQTVGPRTTFTTGTTTILRVGELEAILNGIRGIFVWGGIDYIDAFKEPRHSSFRYVNGEKITQVVNGEQILIGWKLQHMKKGNEAD